MQHDYHVLEAEVQLLREQLNTLFNFTNPINQKERKNQMIKIVYMNSAQHQYKTEFFNRLNRVVQSLPDDVFYRKDIMPEDLNKEFNAVIVAELKKEFKDSLIVTESYEIKRLLPYHIDVLVALFSFDIHTWYTCIFQPYRKSVLVWRNNGRFIKFMAKQINRKLSLKPIWVNVTDTYTIGYIDPRESIGVVG